MQPFPFIRGPGLEIARLKIPRSLDFVVLFLILFLGFVLAGRGQMGTGTGPERSSAPSSGAQGGGFRLLNLEGNGTGTLRGPDLVMYGAQLSLQGPPGTVSPLAVLFPIALAYDFMEIDLLGADQENAASDAAPAEGGWEDIGIELEGSDPGESDQPEKVIFSNPTEELLVPKRESATIPLPKGRLSRGIKFADPVFE